MIKPVEIAALIGAGALATTVVVRAIRNTSDSALKGCDLPRVLTYPKIFYAGVADQIYQAMYYHGAIISISEDDQAVFDGLALMMTTADVKELICAYGTRNYDNAIDAALSPDMSLPQVVSKWLDDDLREQLNALYEQRQIGFRWV